MVYAVFQYDSFLTDSPLGITYGDMTLPSGTTSHEINLVLAKYVFSIAEGKAVLYLTNFIREITLKFERW